MSTPGRHMTTGWPDSKRSACSLRSVTLALRGMLLPCGTESTVTTMRVWDIYCFDRCPEMNCRHRDKLSYSLWTFNSCRVRWINFDQWYLHGPSVRTIYDSKTVSKYIALFR